MFYVLHLLWLLVCMLLAGGVSGEVQTAGNNTPGTSDYPRGGMRLVHSQMLPHFDNMEVSLVDSRRGLAYFGSNISGQCALHKFRLDPSGGVPVYLDSLSVDQAGGALTGLVLDEDSSIAYALMGGSGQLCKLFLGDEDAPMRILTQVPLTNEDPGTTLLLDQERGILYLCGGTRIVKYSTGSGEGPPVRLSSVSITLALNSEGIRTGQVDAERDIALIGVFDAPPRVLKVALTDGVEPPLIVDELEVPEADYNFENMRKSLRDPLTGAVIFTVQQSPAALLKVLPGEDDGPPVFGGIHTLANGEDQTRSVAMQSGGGFVHVGVSGPIGPGVVKVAVGALQEPLTRVGRMDLQVADGFSMASAPWSGHVVHVLPRSIRRLIVTTNGTPNGAPVQLGMVDLGAGSRNVDGGVAHPVEPVAILGTTNGFGPNRIFKVAYEEDNSPPKWLSELRYDQGVTSARHLFIHPQSAELFAGLTGSPDRILRASIPSGTGAPVALDQTDLPANEYLLGGVLAEFSRGLLHYASGIPNNSIITYAIGSGAAPLQRLGALTLPEGETSPGHAAHDPVGNYGYWSVSPGNASLLKVHLGSGSALPRRVASVNLGTGESFVTFIIVDPIRRRGYVGITGDARSVIMFDLGIGDATPVLLGELALPGQASTRFHSGFLDQESGHLYLSANVPQTTRVTLSKWKLSDSGGLPQYIGMGDPGPAGGATWNTLHRPGSAYAILTGGSSLSHALKYSLGQKGFLHGTRLTVTEDTLVEAVHFHSHRAVGNVRLSIHRDGDELELLWESPVLQNNVVDAALSVPIEEGTPASLYLPPGDYWLAWQLDRNAEVPSHTIGDEAEGFAFPHRFGPVPGFVSSSGLLRTTDRWTQFITYRQGVPTPTPTASPSPSPTGSPTPSLTPTPSPTASPSPTQGPADWRNIITRVLLNKPPVPPTLDLNEDGVTDAGDLASASLPRGQGR